MVFGLDGTRRAALGHFLRERRAEIAPEEVGIASRRGRRTPGLRREEVAFLADIGVKWYARLEAGDDVHPSAATLTGIAFALRLSSAELEYVLELAGLPQPLPATAEVDTGDRRADFVAHGQHARRRGYHRRSNSHAASLECAGRCCCAVILVSTSRQTATRSSEACSNRTTSRSSVRRERRSCRGRWACSGSIFGPPGRARSLSAVYEMIKDDPLFQQAWRREIVACDTDEGERDGSQPCGRRKARWCFRRDFSTSGSADLILRTLCPADEETAEKFQPSRKGRQGLRRERTIPVGSLRINLRLKTFPLCIDRALAIAA